MTIPLDLEADNPAVVYLESLSKGCYWAVRHSLETIAEILAGEDADPWTFPWEELRTSTRPGSGGSWSTGTPRPR